MAPRAYWDGYVRLSLVTFPVRLYPAVTAMEKVRLHKIDRKSGKRIHYQNITEDMDVVEPDDIVKGYEYEKGHYVPIEDDELKKLHVQSEHMIDLVHFTDLADIDAIYFERPYYISPGSKVAHEAFITLRDSLRATRKVALGQITIASKERISAIQPYGKGLLLETLRYNYEVRKAEEVFDDIPAAFPLKKEQVELAMALIDKKTAPFDPAQFKDSYQEGLLEIINAKLHHRKPALASAKRPSAQVVNIMDALKRSLGDTGKAARRVRKTVKTKKKSRKAG